MPAYVDGAAITVQAGQRQAVLNGESLQSAAASQAVLLKTSGGAPVPLSIVNLSNSAISLQVAAADEDEAYVPWSDLSGNLVNVPAGGMVYVQVTGNLYYRVSVTNDVVPSPPITLAI